MEGQEAIADAFAEKVPADREVRSDRCMSFSHFW
jgi:hypothetical protein